MAWSAFTLKWRPPSSHWYCSGWLEVKARGRTSAAIRQLLGLTPKTARQVLADGTETDVPIATIGVGDRVRVRPGEKIPVDGRVVEGLSHRR